MRARRALARAAAAALLLAPFTLAAQERPVPAEAGSQIEISVLTFGQGDVLFERFGHNALRVRDAATGRDLAYNWGMFDFDQPNFLGRFLSGDTRYWVEAFESGPLIEWYRRQDRTIHEQVLALTPAQRLELARFVGENAREENRYYRYDYFLDNCSTRLRDAIDHALGGSLARRFEPIRTPWTFRSESVRLMTPDGLAQAGIDIALGPRADEPISAWEAMFIPMRLRDCRMVVRILRVLPERDERQAGKAREPQPEHENIEAMQELPPRPQGHQHQEHQDRARNHD